MSVDIICQAQPEIFEKAKEDLGEDDDKREQTLRLMREWIAKQPHFRCRTDDHFILAFARGCKYSMEKMKQKIDLTLTMRTALPEFFSGWNPFSPQLQTCLSPGTFLPLPGYDCKGQKVILMRMGCFNPYLVKHEDVEKASFMICEVLGNTEEQFFATGMILIFDLAGYSMAHLTTRPVSLSKKHLRYLQDASPISPKSLNFVNAPTAFSSGYNLMMGLLKDKMKQRVKIHSDYDSLHKAVDRSFLPKDYGGNGMPVAQLIAHWKKRVEDSADFLMEQEQYRVDESRRPGKPKTVQDLFGIEGSFRKLNVD